MKRVLDAEGRCAWGLGLFVEAYSVGRVVDQKEVGLIFLSERRRGAALLA